MLDKYIYMYILFYMNTNLTATRSLQKWGNSSGVRLPSKIIKAARLHDDQQLSVSLRGRSIILTPLNTEEDLTLKSMLRGVTPKDVHGEVDWGMNVGAETIDA